MDETTLADAYAGAIADNPSYPYESAEEKAALRGRRNRRQAEADG